jgi:hypothetical protein
VTNETLRKQNQRFCDQTGMNMSLYGSPYVQQTQSATLTETLIVQEEIVRTQKSIVDLDDEQVLFLK